MSNKFTEKAEKALNNAVKIAEGYGHTYIGSEHILHSLCSDALSCSFAILSKCGITKEKIETGIKEYSGSGIKSTLSAKDMTPRCKSIVENSYKISIKYSSSKIGTEHLLLALLDERNSVAIKILEFIGADITLLKDEVITFLRSTDKALSQKKTASTLSYLNQYGKNLNQLAKEGKLDPVIGRDTETERLIRILSRRTKNNPCLIGEAGVGKTAIVEGLAKRIIDKNVPETLINKVVYSLDLTSMIAGAKYRGDFEERIKSIIFEASKNNYIILFIDEIHTIVGAGSAEGAIDAANILKPELSRSNIQLIGATTLAEYRKYIEKDPALERRFQPLLIEATDVNATIDILLKVKQRYEEHHSVRISNDAIISAVKLSDRYIQDRQLPDKALDLLDETCAKVNVNNFLKSKNILNNCNNSEQKIFEKEIAIKEGDLEKALVLHKNEIADKKDSLLTEVINKDNFSNEVTKEDIKQVLTEITGIPIGGINEDEDYDGLEERLSAAIFGQDEAVKLLTNAIMRSKVGINDPFRPKGVFMFLGESGVGKTALAKAMAEELFSEKNAFVRLDMSEFGEKHSVSKIIGSPPGYVGYEEGGNLTEKVRRHPYCVLLFDEIEKASEEVQNLLLQIMDDGILTDSSGRRVNFRNTFIIMTSNIGADIFDKSTHMGFVESAKSIDTKKINELLKKHLKPEFINRIDEIIPFSPLNKDTLSRISDKMLKALKKRLKAIGINLEYTYEVCSYISEKGLVKGFGARPLARLIVTEIENEITNILINNKDSVSKISIYVDENSLLQFNIKNEVPFLT